MNMIIRGIRSLGARGEVCRSGKLKVVARGSDGNGVA